MKYSVVYQLFNDDGEFVADEDTIVDAESPDDAEEVFLDEYQGDCQVQIVGVELIDD